MNEDDQKTLSVKDAKLSKTTKEKSQTKSAKAKAPKTTKAATAIKAKTTVKAKSETNTKVAAKVKATTKTTEKAVAKSVVKAEPKAAKPRAKKAVAKTSAEELVAASKPFVVETPKQKEVSESITAVKLSPIFKELAEPKLPALREENRAFLQMQSPTRAFFYWSLKQNSEMNLRKTLGNRANEYFFAVRLINLRNNREEIHQVGNRGSWWFNNVEADTKYRAEVGFYAHNRPFVRLIFSNTLQTPRLKPSANTAYQPYFAVTANQFADVLDMAGFSQDAFDVYVAGDKPKIADNATQNAFLQLAGDAEIDFSNINLSELRYILFALASGVSLVTLREQISTYLFAFLGTLVEENPNALTEEKVILALEEFFGYSLLEEDEIAEEFSQPTVFGASLINFPKGMRKTKSSFSPNKTRFSEGKLSPVSSFSLK